MHKVLMLNKRQIKECGSFFREFESFKDDLKLLDDDASDSSLADGRHFALRLAGSHRPVGNVDVDRQL